MRGITLPIVLASIGVIITFVAYRNMRRGGARFYTLEREALLRRAGYTLILAMLFFIAAVGLLIWDYQLTNVEEAAEAGITIEGFDTPTPEPVIEQFPPTPTPSATPNPEIPTPTPTVILRRALIDGTGGNGLYLRESPGGEPITILPDGSFVTLLETAPVPGDGFNWLHVRTTVAGEEGWVADLFLITSDN